MNPSATVGSTPSANARQHETSLDASDDFDEPRCDHEFPTQLCESFMSLMAGHGRSVDLETMRVDRAYAMWQLARAHTMTDAALREIACALFAHYDQARRIAGMVSMGNMQKR